MIGSPALWVLVLCWVGLGRSMDLINMSSEKSNKPAYNHTHISEEDLRKILETASQNVDSWIRPWVRSEGSKGEWTRLAFIAEDATRLIAQREGLTRMDITHGLDHLSAAPKEECPAARELMCPNQQYASYDGTCNNVEHAQWGAVNTSFSRFLTPIYEDDIGHPRGEQQTGLLPTAAEAAKLALQEAKLPGLYLTPLFSLWGDFVEKDIARVSRQGSVLMEGKCCEDNSHPECHPILSNHTSGYCQGYIRSRPALKSQCQLGPREQQNEVSTFLDGSAVYGVSKNYIDEIRLKKNVGKGTVPVPPLDVTPSQQLLNCSSSHCLKRKLFSVLQILFLREHNRLAEALNALNPHWSDTVVFEEARKIVVAEIQHITYNEFLPVLLGESTMIDNELKVMSSGFDKNYNLDLKPAVSNEIAVLGLGFLTSLFNEKLDDMKDAFTMAATYLIHQGRDHGVPPYNKWREFCNLPVATTFDELVLYMTESGARHIIKMYSTVDEVDLLVGGLLEKSLDGAVFGPTLTCLMSLQFKLLRHSDRFWYENNIPPAAFNKDQLEEIRKVTLSSLLCNNMENIKLIQSNAFLQEDLFLNAPVHCVIIPTLSLTPWQDGELPELVLPQQLLEDAIDKAKMQLAERHLAEMELWATNQIAQKGSAQRQAFSFHKPSEEAVQLSNRSLVLEFTSHEILNYISQSDHYKDRVKRQIDPNNEFNQNLNSIQDFAQVLPQVHIRNLVQNPETSFSSNPCQRKEEGQTCDPKTTYRTYSGWCNNLNYPHFGKALSPFNRLLASRYDDGVSQPHLKSITGTFLPSARVISTYIHADVSHPHSRYTYVLMQYGQFLDHDITLTPVTRGFRESALDCRDCESALRIHPECLPIPIPPNDPHYPALNVSTGRPFCLSFTRSIPGQQNLGPREQLNQNTAFLDASQIYGSDLCIAYSLRSFSEGRLNVTRNPIRGKDLLPQSHHVKDCESNTGKCFQAGDDRPSEHPGLAAFHTLFLREHNHIVEGLGQLNSHWSDEKLYQNGRKIMGAMLQHITYNEYLPRILGWNAIKLYGLDLKTSGYRNDYDSQCNPGILNEFATAAYRFGHSLIRPLLLRMDPFFRHVEPDIKLRDHFNNPDKLYEPNMIDEVMRGLMNTQTENLDPFVTSEVTNHLFEHKNQPHSGLDLIALNIQRGRDHGLRSYNDYRVICNLKRASDFEDLSREISQVVIDRLKQIYAHVDDIDLFTGGLVETPLEGGVVGPTFGCIIGLQFRFTMKCDRFWYETGDPVVRFTEAQLTEIRKASLSKIVCANCDLMDRVQRRVLDMPHDFLNPRVPCESLPGVDLRPWQENFICNIGGNDVQVGQVALTSPCTQCTCTTEGPQCSSLRITDCNRLIQTAGVDAVKNDNVCRSQCGQLLQQGTRTGRQTGFRLPNPFNIQFNLPRLRLPGI